MWITLSAGGSLLHGGPEQKGTGLTSSVTTPAHLQSCDTDKELALRTREGTKCVVCEQIAKQVQPVRMAFELVGHD